MRQYILIVSIFIFANLHLIYAQEYKAAELFTIAWGEAPEQLKIEEPFYYDTCGTPGDISDDIIEEFGGGPTIGFVDKNENAYFSSYRLHQFKAFDAHGNLILDFSRGTPGYNNEFFDGSPRSFVVDSQQQMYFTSFDGKPYIPVVDVLGNLLSKLYPCGKFANVVVYEAYLAFNDIIVFDCFPLGYRSYKEGQFLTGGGPGLAIDSNCYEVREIDGIYLEFMKQGFLNKSDSEAHRESKVVKLENEILGAHLLGVDEILFFMYQLQIL